MSWKFKSGNNNCQGQFSWGKSDRDCCFDIATRVCNASDHNVDNCCSETGSVGEGDCDDDSECLGSLKAGIIIVKVNLVGGSRTGIVAST